MISTGGVPARCDTTMYRIRTLPTDLGTHAAPDLATLWRAIGGGLSESPTDVLSSQINHLKPKSKDRPQMARQLHALLYFEVRGCAMRMVKFSEDNVANELARMSDTELDSLAFGAIELDRDGKILRYNAAEADISSRDQAGMVGRNFFSDVAPCTRGEAFEGRFRAGVKLGQMDVQFTYVLDHKMLPTEVRVRMHQAEGKDSYWVLIKRVTAAAVQ